MNNLFFTGISGFLGQEFLRYCNAHTPCVFKILPMPKNYRSGEVNYKYTFSPDDFDEKIDILVHAGAFSPKTREQMEDVELNITNPVNTDYLLKNLPNIPKKIIYISTISVYSKNQSVITEKASLGGDSVYGISKLMCEKIIENYCKQNNVEYQILRLGVIYGNNPKVQGLIPTFIKNICQNKNLNVYNDGSQKRNFINVYDVARIIHKSINESVKYPIINVVGDSSISVKEIAELLINYSGKDIGIDNILNNIKQDDTIFDPSLMIKAFKNNEIDYKSGLLSAYNALSEVYNESM